MNKKEYEVPEYNVTLFTINDVITTSGEPGGNDNDHELPDF